MFRLPLAYWHVPSLSSSDFPNNMGVKRNYSVPNYVILSKIMLQALWMAKYCPQHSMFNLYVSFRCTSRHTIRASASRIQMFHDEESDTPKPSRRWRATSSPPSEATYSTYIHHHCRRSTTTLALWNQLFYTQAKAGQNATSILLLLFTTWKGWCWERGQRKRWKPAAFRPFALFAEQTNKRLDCYQHLSILDPHET